MKKIFLLSALMLLNVSTFAADIVKLKSPDRQLSAILLQENGTTCLDVKNASGALMTRIDLGFSTTDEDYTSLTASQVGKVKTIQESYELVHGKKSHAGNKAKSVNVTFLNAFQSPVTIELRVWNDGVTFRYVLPDNGKERTFKNEATAYHIESSMHRWLQKFTTSYEDDYVHQATEGQQGDWGFPCLFEKDKCFMLITEANSSRMYCNTHLSNKTAPGTYQVNYPFDWEGNGIGESCPKWKGQWFSPWRVLIIGTLQTLVSSTLVEDCAEPCKLTDTSWIVPGGAAWVYWAYNHGTRDFQICKQYVDLAKEMGWQYVLFDWEWDTMTNGGNIEDACRYALSQGVRPLMWYNSGGPHTGVTSTPRDRMLTHESRVKEFAWLKSIGVAGVKVDFFESDKQQMINYFIDILEDAAQAKMMVNFHGATIPRGWTRTYPNLMSTEGVYGAEQYNNGSYMTDNGCHVNCVLPFTRNVVGPMDYTPVAFTDSQHRHTTTYAHELALSVVFESAIQHWADRPQGFYDLPEAPKSFMKEIPTAWDETRLIDGYPAERVVMARRKGNDWYVGGLEGTSQKTTFSIKLDFLRKGVTYQMVLNADGAEMSQFSTSRRNVRHGDIIEIPCLPRGGFAMSIKPE